MSVVTTHGVTLRGGDAARKIVLCLLADEHLPWLYKWNADPEVLYYTQGGTAEGELSYLPEVRQMYPQGMDVRRIDMYIGEMEWWGRRVGSCSLPCWCALPSARSPRMCCTAFVRIITSARAKYGKRTAFPWYGRICCSSRRRGGFCAISA